MKNEKETCFLGGSVVTCREIVGINCVVFIYITDNICTWFATRATVTGARQQDEPFISKGELTRLWQERQSEVGEIIHNGSRKTSPSGCSVDQESIRQNFYRDENIARQKYVCRDKSFVAASILLWRQKTRQK